MENEWGGEKKGELVVSSTKTFLCVKEMPDIESTTSYQQQLL